MDTGEVEVEEEGAGVVDGASRTVEHDMKIDPYAPATVDGAAAVVSHAAEVVDGATEAVEGALEVDTRPSAAEARGVTPSPPRGVEERAGERRPP